MRVRLKGGIDFADKDRPRIAAWLQPGIEYVVLEVDGEWLRIEETPEEGAPGLWEARLFDVVDPTLPPNWIGEIGASTLSFAPRPWLRPGFWEEFFNDEPEARAIYEEEKAIIVAAADA